MKITSYGAAEGVTGSCHLLEVADQRILLDCGMFQGGSDQREKNDPPPPVDPTSIDWIIASHGHLDHIGRIPLFVRLGFDGRIVSTRGTYEIARISLMDSANLLESAAERRNRGRSRDTERIQPLYDQKDVLDTIDLWDDLVEYHDTFELADGVKLTFYDAGHILGSACVFLELDDGDKQRRLLFSGDIGNVGKPIIKDPETPPEADLVLLESTYGDRDHRDFDESVAELEDAIRTVVGRNGNVIIPTFAIERAQEMLYVLYEAWRDGRIPKTADIYLDSPMAISVTRVFADLPRYYDEEILELAESGGNPFNFGALVCTGDTRESMRINEQRAGAVVLAGSGMMTGGRVLHHLKHNIMRPECGLIICGFQAENTLGRRIVNREPEVKIMGEYYPVNAQVWTINGFSAHGGQTEMTEWAKHTKAERVMLVHGEEDAKDAFQAHLEREMPDTEVGQMRFGEAVEI